MTSVSRQRKGFTLIELLTVIAIIGILAAVLFPGVQGVMRSAKKNSALNKLRSIGQGYMNWAQGGRTMKLGAWVPGGQSVQGISDFAAHLAFGASLDAAELWFVDGDSLLDNRIITTMPKNVIQIPQGAPAVKNPAFMAALGESTGTSWSVYSPTSPGLVGNIIAPIAWTRGLGESGDWGAATGDIQGSVWGPEGGHIVYGDGHVSWATNTREDGNFSFTNRTTNAPAANWRLSQGVPGTVTLLPQN
jgi:prepilin-type N-terminal cleavage/methylation domain-containing protein